MIHGLAFASYAFLLAHVTDWNTLSEIVEQYAHDNRLSNRERESLDALSDRVDFRFRTKELTRSGGLNA